ncbi:neurogenic locus notch homolog protein 1 [Lingula anatina]|uniref:Neurogenic locus notch homolog protein 1 n=1 Tax=Lingula anatina TaxID=7574 RepID=A0A1S3ICL2_LINAN|nr:neurogenic locus notch homolog protein 1 [Lingula anatina]|eukprot:XP_013395596.1 neurogenic locus notch homolog protein 1 [Lingula anatina]
MEISTVTALVYMWMKPVLGCLIAGSGFSTKKQAQKHRPLILKSVNIVMGLMFNPHLVLALMTWTFLCPSQCNGAQVPCAENGKCVVEKKGVIEDRLHNNDNCNTAFGQYCVCEDGYEGDGYTSCTDINECDANLCLNNATCENRPGSFKCYCPGDIWGSTCNKVPCATNGKCVVQKKWGIEDRLHNNDGCNQEYGQYCVCLDGFEGDGYTSCISST